MRLDPHTVSGWSLRVVDEASVPRLAAALGIHPVTARTLAGRGVIDPEAAARFLTPSLGDLPDPSAIPDMDCAVTRIAAALRDRETIAVFGDYDVDGITGTALLEEFLAALGSPPMAALPRRLEGGYGLSPEAVEALAARGARLIVTVDNGSSAHEAIRRAKEIGVDVVVTDHHLLEAPPPEACAVVNPKRLPQGTGLDELSGCGVAFMLALALRRRLRSEGRLPSPEPNLKRLLDLVALGTIADVMPLAGVNRILVRHGLAELAAAARPGIRALLAVAGTSPSTLSTHAVAFRLAPRLNAAGRLGDAMPSLALLTSRDEAEVQRLAAALDAANRERQRLEEAILREASEAIGRGDDDAIVVHGEDWHVGVIGIVAGKLAERAGRPAIVITRGCSPARGSARSGGAVNLIEALGDCADLLDRFGGHAAAAGLSIETSRIPAFVERFRAACARREATAPAMLAIDAEVDPRELTFDLLSELESIAPFGCGNPEPLLAFREVDLCDQRIVGTGHLKLRVAAGGRTFDAIGFNMAGAHPLPPRVRLAFTPERNTWNGTTSLQLKLRAIAAPTPNV